MQLLRDNLTLWTSDNAVFALICLLFFLSFIYTVIVIKTIFWHLILCSSVLSLQEDGGDEIKEAAKPEGEGH